MTAETRQAEAIAALNALEADDFAPVLLAASTAAHQAGVDLNAAWQDRAPEQVWNRIGNALYTAARKVQPR